MTITWQPMLVRQPGDASARGCRPGDAPGTGTPAASSSGADRRQRLVAALAVVFLDRLAADEALDIARQGTLDVDHVDLRRPVAQLLAQGDRRAAPHARPPPIRRRRAAGGGHRRSTDAGHGLAPAAPRRRAWRRRARPATCRPPPRRSPPPAARAQCRKAALQIDPVLDDRVADGHVAGDPAEQRGAERDDDREAVHQLQQQPAAEDDHRDRDHQADDQQRQCCPWPPPPRRCTLSRLITRSASRIVLIAARHACRWPVSSCRRLRPRASAASRRSTAAAPRRRASGRAGAAARPRRWSARSRITIARAAAPGDGALALLRRQAARGQRDDHRVVARAGRCSVMICTSATQNSGLARFTLSPRAIVRAPARPSPAAHASSDCLQQALQQLAHLRRVARHGEAALLHDRRAWRRRCRRRPRSARRRGPCACRAAR